MENNHAIIEQNVGRHVANKHTDVTQITTTRYV
jgi:hypothetical protein